MGYILSHDPINEKELNNLQQLPTPYILRCDFNSHNNIWGCKSTNKKAEYCKTLSIIIICLFNPKSQTHIDPSSDTYSTVDFTFCDTSVFRNFSRSVHEERPFPYYDREFAPTRRGPSPIDIHHHHHHIALVARISLTLSRHSSLSFIALGRSSGQHPVSSHSC